MATHNKKIQHIYDHLLDQYGPQGWWPLTAVTGTNPTKTGSLQGYHPGLYHHPTTDDERFEICLGAILTQNTNWVNVEKALFNLKNAEALSCMGIKLLADEKLKTLIQPAGYFNQKAKKIRFFVDFYMELDGATPTRQDLLAIWGVGPETADSMLLYAYQQPTFVIDAYTKRIFIHLGLATENTTYDELKNIFEESLNADWIIYQEYHALIVEHAKRHYNKKPWGVECSLKLVMGKTQNKHNRSN